MALAQCMSLLLWIRRLNCKIFCSLLGSGELKLHHILDPVLSVLLLHRFSLGTFLRCCTHLRRPGSQALHNPSRNSHSRWHLILSLNGTCLCPTSVSPVQTWLPKGDSLNAELRSGQGAEHDFANLLQPSLSLGNSLL